MPAHVVAKQAGTDTAGLIKAIETDDAATLTKVADFWNTGWTLDKAKGLPDASLIPSSGPYYVAAWDPGQSVTLKKNAKWWGTPAKTDTVVLRFISPGPAGVRAVLRRGRRHRAAAEPGHQRGARPRWATRSRPITARSSPTSTWT